MEPSLQSVTFGRAIGAAALRPFLKLAPVAELYWPTHGSRGESLMLTLEMIVYCSVKNPISKRTVRENGLGEAHRCVEPDKPSRTSNGPWTPLSPISASIKVL